MGIIISGGIIGGAMGVGEDEGCGRDVLILDAPICGGSGGGAGAVCALYAR